MTGSGLLYLWVALGGALGSAARFGAAGLAARKLGMGFPWGTLLVNVTGSLLIGLIAGLAGTEGGRLALTPGARAFLLVGVLGGFTTFSAFSLETLTLARAGQWLAASANAVVSLGLCLGAVWLGHAAAGAFSR